MPWWFDYQVLWHYHFIISDSAMWKRLQNVYSQMKHTRLKPLSQFIWQPPPLHPVSYQPPTHRRLLVFPACGLINEEFEGFLHVRSIVSHLHVHTREQSVNQHNLVTWSRKRALILPNPIPSELLLARQCASKLQTELHSTASQPWRIFRRLIWSHNRWSKESNTVLPPVRQLNVSDLLRTDLTKVYCWKVS